MENKDEKTKRAPVPDSPLSSDSESWSSGGSTDSEPDTMLRKMLDIKSPHFNPTIALVCKPPPDHSYSARGSPSKKTPPYFSIAQFRNSVPDFTRPPLPGRGRGRGRDGGKIPITTPGLGVANPEPSTSSSSQVQGPEPYYPIPGRKFLPHQLPVFRPRKEKPNVITLMDSLTGPLAGINEAKKKSSRIKVWTRNENGINGYCTGVPVAFDKHWNLALRDVAMQWLRKRKTKFFSQACTADEANAKGIPLPKVMFESLIKKENKIQKDLAKGIETMTMIESGKDAHMICRVGFHLPQPPDFLPPSKGNGTPCTKSEMRKKRVKVLNPGHLDFQGGIITAVSQKYELVQRRRIPQVVLLGKEIVFVETESDIVPEFNMGSDNLAVDPALLAKMN